MIIIGKNVLVTSVEAKKETASGIILATDTATGQKPAKVLGVGRGCISVCAGDVVYLDWTKTMPVEIDGMKCAVVDEEFVKLILERE
jgi:co-chaperonin GroES (HSP10)